MKTPILTNCPCCDVVFNRIGKGATLSAKCHQSRKQTGETIEMYLEWKCRECGYEFTDTPQKQITYKPTSDMVEAITACQATLSKHLDNTITKDQAINDIMGILDNQDLVKSIRTIL